MGPEIGMLLLIAYKGNFGRACAPTTHAADFARKLGYRDKRRDHIE